MRPKDNNFCGKVLQHHPRKKVLIAMLYDDRSSDGFNDKDAPYNFSSVISDLLKSAFPCLLLPKKPYKSACKKPLFPSFLFFSLVFVIPYLSASPKIFSMCRRNITASRLYYYRQKISAAVCAVCGSRNHMTSKSGTYSSYAISISD